MAWTRKMASSGGGGGGGGTWGSITGDIEDQLDLIALLNSKVDAVTSTDNAIVRFDGTSGQVQNSLAFVDDDGGLTARNLHDVWIGWPSQTAGMQRKNADANGIALTSGALQFIVDLGGQITGFHFVSGNAPTVLQFSGGSSELAILRGRNGDQFNSGMGIRINGANQIDTATANTAGFLDLRGGDSSSPAAPGANWLGRGGNNSDSGMGGDASLTPGTSATGTAGALLLGIPSIDAAANGGFPYMPTISGAPSGTPTAKTGYVPFAFQVSAKKLWVYDGTSWVGMVLL